MLYNHNIIILRFIKGSENINHDSEDWTDAIDRGGLKHVSDTLFMFFYSMEKELRCHVRAKCASEIEGIKEKVIKKIIENDDVTFYWSVVAANWEEEEAGVLLEMVIQHWVTIRGFSYASAFVEKYKQKNKKTVQKSKGLRKNLINSNAANE